MKSVQRNIIVTILCAFTGLTSFCQTTGSFEETISIGIQQYTLAYHVPTSYNSLKKYPLIIGLHGCGGTGEDYRNTLKPLSDSLDAIVLCPDNSYSQFIYSQKQVILKSIEFTRASYNIDTTSIILTGFSCNGYVTFYWGLESIYKFRGIIPFNAFLYDIQPNTFNYKSKIPTCICSGTADDNYPDNQQVFNYLLNNGGIGFFNAMEGINHTTDFPSFTSEMLECFKFFDSISPLPNGINPAISKENDVFIYPNPTNGIINIATKPGEHEFNISLIDINGKNVRVFSHIKPGNLKLDFQSIRLSKGVYTLKINNSDKTITKSIIYK